MNYYKETEKWPVNTPESWKKEDKFQSVFLNEYGYYELRNQNTTEERGKNFEENYFQEYSGYTYAKEYSSDEMKSILSKIEQRAYIIKQNLIALGNWKGGKYSLLDIGCGEGFLLKYFHDHGVRVKGIDLGSYALQQFNPELLALFEQGDMQALLPEMERRQECYDVINMDRVMDMVSDAGVCLEAVRPLMAENSLLIIKVANNYSNLQRMLLQSGELKEEYWLDDPDHTGYFNREGLIALLKHHGFSCMDFYGDTFVDFNLLNPLTNYYERPESGKAVHRTTVRLENLLHDVSMERTVEIYRMLGDMGFGREIVGVFRKSDKEQFK